MGARTSKVANGLNLKHCMLWKADRSPACRAVMMAVDAMNLNVTEIDVNMDKGEHRSPEIVFMNPLQTLPVLRDRELVLYDSHAITTYLASRYCNIGCLLPQDPGGRAKTDQLLHYDNSILYPRFRAAANPILYEDCRFVMPQQVCDIEYAYADLECLLAGRCWFGISWPTLSDISIAATVSTLNVLVPIDVSRFPRLSTWLHCMSEQGYYATANRSGLCEFSRRIDCGCCEDKPFQCPRTSLTRRSGAGIAEGDGDCNK